MSGLPLILPAVGLKVFASAWGRARSRPAFPHGSATLLQGWSELVAAQQQYLPGFPALPLFSDNNEYTLGVACRHCYFLRLLLKAHDALLNF